MIPRMPEFLADLKRAGIQEFDALGHRADFHALRHTLCTGLGRVGVAPRAAMELMRHSDMRLTNMNYTDISQLPLLEALYKLPRWADSNPENTKPDSDKIVSQTGDVQVILRHILAQLMAGISTEIAPYQRVKTG